MTTPAQAKAQALKRVQAAQRMLNGAERTATKYATNRDQVLLDAQRNGATYDELEAATGLSTSRVNQVLRRARDAQAKSAS